MGGRAEAEGRHTTVPGLPPGAEAGGGGGKGPWLGAGAKAGSAIKTKGCPLALSGGKGDVAGGSSEGRARGDGD